MKTLFCVDLVFSDKQVVDAFTIIKSKVIEGDRVVVFDYASAKEIHLYEVDLILKNKLTSELRRSLYKKRKKIVGFGIAGSKLAAEIVGNDYKKICFTNKFITDDEVVKYNEVVLL